MLRDHEVEVDPQSGLISLLGGKWTTYRLMAQDAVDAVCRLLEITTPCSTENHALYGATGWHPQLADELQAGYGLDRDICTHLSHKYGSFAGEVARLCGENAAWSGRILPGYPYLKAEVVYAVRKEMACTLRDFLARRIRLEVTNWKETIAATPVVAGLMASELDWSKEKTEQEILEYTALVQGFISKVF